MNKPSFFLRLIFRFLREDCTPHPFEVAWYYNNSDQHYTPRIEFSMEEYISGRSLEEIASSFPEVFGDRVTRERVRQLLIKACR